MAVEILWDPERDVAAMYCNTSDTAFGPIFTGPLADTEASAFLDWLKAEPRDTSSARIMGDGTDPRDYPADHLEELVRHWREETGA